MEKTFDEAFKEYHEALERERKEAEESKVYADEYFSELARQRRERQDYINFCIIRAGELADEERQEKARAEIAAAKEAAEAEIMAKYRQENPAEWNRSKTDAALKALDSQLFGGVKKPL